MQLKDYIAESFKKEYAYRVKLAADCGAEHMASLKSALQKYNLVSAAPWKRTPIQDNPMEFYRAKGVKLITEVCSTDVILKYPVNERILEVWLAVNMGLDHERVIVYTVNDPRKAESEAAEARVENDKDRTVEQKDSVLNNEEQAHYESQQDDGKDDVLFGEAFNKKFLDQLAKIRKEKGADYFRNYPTKDGIMGDDLRAYWEDLNKGTNMGQGQETKAVDVISQSSRRN